MRKIVRIAAIGLLGLSLVACTSISFANAPSIRDVTVQPSVPSAIATGPSLTPTSPSTDLPLDLTRTDGQGAVTVEIKPLNLDHPGDTLDFDVEMNTHSVDLGMDLTQLATLTTDSSQPIPASKWDTPQRGGHHVSGTLSFPTSYEGKPVLPGATRITITIQNVDAATRLFTWQLPQ
jgi:hypothetical protein